MTEQQKQNSPVFSHDNHYPIPDPSWDYADIYHKMQSAKVRLDKAIQFISQFEENDQGATDDLIDRLQQIERLWKDFCYEPDN